MAPAPLGEIDGRAINVHAGQQERAFFATRFRHPLPAQLADALLHAASADGDDYVRRDAVAVLRQNPTASLRIPETLARIAEADADSGIRRQAGKALTAITPASPIHR